VDVAHAPHAGLDGDHVASEDEARGTMRRRDDRRQLYLLGRSVRMVLTAAGSDEEEDSSRSFI